MAQMQVAGSRTSDLENNDLSSVGTFLRNRNVEAVELTKGGRKPNPKALLELMRRHDQEPVEMEGWTF